MASVLALYFRPQVKRKAEGYTLWLQALYVGAKATDVFYWKYHKSKIEKKIVVYAVTLHFAW